MIAKAIGNAFMSKLMTSLGGNTGAILAGGAMVAALCLGGYLSFSGQTPDAVPTSVVSSEVTQSQGADAGTQAEPTEAATITAPSFDELRREPDGTTIIAGRAEPLSDVRILLDGEQVGTATADSTGGFAAIASLPATGAAQVVSLSAQSEGENIVSVDEIILAPSQVPAVQEEVAMLPATSEPVEVVVTDAPLAPMSDEPAQEEPVPQTPRVAVLKSDADGVSLLSPVVTSEVALDTIGYSELGEVQLTGRAQPDTAKVRVYLNNRSVVSLPVGSDGRWRGDLPDVDEGVYTLRVDEVSEAGIVSSRVETPFKRESAQVLAQASANADGPIKTITVQTGATLWAIARDRYGDGTLFVRVVEANGDTIRNPDLIYPGQVFDLPN
jgi:nucleoid-associated protein YgaU